MAFAPTQVVLVSATLPHEVLEMTHKVGTARGCVAISVQPGCDACLPHCSVPQVAQWTSDFLLAFPQFMTDPVRILVKRDELTLEVRGLPTHWAVKNGPTPLPQNSSRPALPPLPQNIQC